MNNPSLYYIYKINSLQSVKGYTDISIAFDIKKKKFCYARIRTKPRYDIMEVKHLLEIIKELKTFYEDTTYDAE